VYRFCAGALTKQDAWSIAYFRGVLAAKLTKVSNTKGAMIAVGLSPTEAQPFLERVSAKLGGSRLVIACVNSRKSVTVSGDSAHIDSLHDMLEDAQVFARKLKVSLAYHSFQMREIADEYLSTIGHIALPDVTTSRVLARMVSSVTGSWASRDELAKPEYWVRNLVSPVLFSDALATLCSSKNKGLKNTDTSHVETASISDLLEIGPHSALQGPTMETLRSLNQDKNIRYMSVLVRKVSAVHSMLDVAGNLYCLGYPIDLQQVNSKSMECPPETAPKTLSTLPEYPFNHTKSYWAESRISKEYRFRRFPRHELLGVPASDWNPLEARWRNTIRISDLPWVEDHKVTAYHSLTLSMSLPVWLILTALYPTDKWHHSLSCSWHADHGP
jgi:acyl transferase domain-containing protein